jgi:hypothetical protein
MGLSPNVTGAAMAANSVPHLLSLLWRLCPAGGRLSRIHIEHRDNTSLDIHFNYEHCQGRTEATLSLRQAPRQPRPAGYSIDGRSVRRVVEMPEYRQFFERSAADLNAVASATSQRVPLEDPLRLLLADFLARVGQSHCGDAVWQDDTLLERLAALRDIAAVVEQAFAGV